MPEYTILTLSGDHYSMGQQHGQQVRHLQPQIAAAIGARFHQIEKDGPDIHFETLVHDTHALLERLDAPLLAMIHGQAQALAFDFDTLLRYNLIAFLRDDLLVRNSTPRSNHNTADPALSCPAESYGFGQDDLASVKSRGHSSPLGSDGALWDKCGSGSWDATLRKPPLGRTASSPHPTAKGAGLGATPLGKRHSAGSQAFFGINAATPKPPQAGGDAGMPEGCTTWAASGPETAAGQPILVKNRDYRPDHLPLQSVVRATPDTGYPYLYVSSACSPGVFSAGINQAGLAVADTHVYSTDLGPGLPSYALMMHILEEHNSAASALDYLRSVPRLGRNNLILADAGGHLAVFEGGHSHFGLFERGGGALVNTNHYASDEMQGYFAAVDPPQARGRSLGRFKSVSRALAGARGRIDLAFARELTAAHDGPLSSICCHPEADTNVTTISATIFLPRQRKMFFCHGLPCEGTFDEFSL